MSGPGDGRGRPSERGQEARARLAENPFYVLELRPDCTRAQVERQGQTLLGMLELELSAALHYRSPLGRHRRSPEQVRAAMAALRDPNRRLMHELWATLDPAERQSASTDPASEPDDALEPFAALAALGFGGGRGDPR